MAKQARKIRRARKLTVVQVYAMHGIKAVRTKNAVKIETPDGIFIPELLQDGNTKTGYHVLTWSLPAGRNGTCICDCEGCYAMQGHYNHDNVKDCLARNLHIVNDYPDFFRRAIIAQIKAHNTKEVRIHAAGDFKTARPAEYASIWHDIAETCTETKFWTYTKMIQFETLFDDLENANVVKSLIPHIGVNFGHCDYIIKAYNYLKSIGESVYICLCGFDKNQHCENCAHCSNAKYVLFVEHGGKYRAEKDPLYETLKKIAFAQE